MSAPDVFDRILGQPQVQHNVLDSHICSAAQLGQTRWRLRMP